MSNCTDDDTLDPYERDFQWGQEYSKNDSQVSDNWIYDNCGFKFS